MSLHLVILFLSAFFLLGIGLFLIQKTQKDEAALALAGTAISIGLWIAVDFYFKLNPNDTHEVMALLLTIPSNYIYICLFHFSIVFPKPILSPKRKQIRLWGYHLTSLFIILWITVFIDNGTVHIFGHDFLLVGYGLLEDVDQFKYGLIPSSAEAYQTQQMGLDLMFLLIWSTVMSVDIIIQILKQIKREINPIRKRQMQIIGYTIIANLVVAFVFNTVLQALGVSVFRNLINILFLIFAANVLYAIVKYETFDIRTAIHHTLFWVTVSVLAIVPGYFLFERLWAVGALMGAPQFAMALVWGALFYFYLSKVQPIINRLFFRRKQKLDQEIEAIMPRLSRIQSLKSYTQEIEKVIKHNLHAKAVLLSTDERMIQHVKNSAGLDLPVDIRDPLWERGVTPKLVVPIQYGPDILGCFVLSEAHHLNPFTPIEKRFLSQLASYTSLFLKNALLYEELEAQIAKALQQDQIQKLSRGILHEVKNTHLSISGLITMILENKITDPKEHDEILNAIAAQSTQLHQFSKNYLVSELLEDDTFQLKKRSVALKPLFEDAIRANLFFLKEKNIQVERNGDDEHVSVDPEKFHLVLSNLICNAGLYGKKQSTLYVTVMPYGTMTQIEIQVEVDSDDSQSHTGTGLGLKVSQDIMAHHHGSIEFQKTETWYKTILTLKE